MQPIAARRAGRLSPWHDQPEMRKLGIVDALQEAEAGAAVVCTADQAKQRHWAEFAVDDARRLQRERAVRVHACGDFGEGGNGLMLVAGA
jgi:hypothetical protein